MIALTSCGGTDGPSVEGATRPAPTEAAASGTSRGPTASPTPAGTDGAETGTADEEDKRRAYLSALRKAGLPVSTSGEREVRAARIACRMVARGVSTDDLAKAITARYPVPEARARRLVQIVVSTYC